MMTYNDAEYLTPAGYGEYELLEKKSRFIARVWPARTDGEAQELLAETRRKYRDATHNVYAYVIRSGQTRCGDDGEPQGTSGLPTLNVFQSENIVDVCCVVTRYYGGVLLGAGGLVRAYSKSAKGALDAAGVNLMRQWSVLAVTCPYAMLERFKQLVASTGGFVESTDFEAAVSLSVLIPAKMAADFTRRSTDISSGSVTPKTVDTVFRGVKIR